MKIQNPQFLTVSSPTNNLIAKLRDWPGHDKETEELREPTHSTQEAEEPGEQPRTGTRWTQATSLSSQPGQKAESLDQSQEGRKKWVGRGLGIFSDLEAVFLFRK